MQAPKLFLLEYEKAGDHTGLPDRITSQYQLRSCLKDKPGRQVYLLTDKICAAPCILKVAPADDLQRFMREHNLLLLLHDEAFPHPVACFAQGDRAFLLREYMPGKTLESLVENRERLPHKQTLAITRRLCAAVEKLHSLRPPYIHRDIKPQNILLTDSGAVRLIDLDTAQEEAPQKLLDTEVLGTAATAAPEQFGYQRSDARADVYGIGMVLLYLLTGCYEPSSLKKASAPHALKRVVRKCLAFDPARRYASVRKLEIRLAAIAGHRGRRVAAAVCAVALTAALFSAPALRGFPVPPAMIPGAAPVPQAVYAFRSPLVESAVRLQLNRPEGLITEADLQNVRELCLCGDTPFTVLGTASSYGDCIFLSGVRCDSRAVLTSWEDFAHLPNLNSLALYRLEISDLSALKDLRLTYLSLGDNDLSSLAGILQFTYLRSLDISTNPIDNLAPLTALKFLQHLNVSSTYAKDLSPLKSMELQSLYAYNMPPGADLSVIPQFTYLQTLGVTRLAAREVGRLKELAGLSNLTLFFPEAGSLEPFTSLDKLTFLNAYGAGIASLEGIATLSGVTELYLENNQITDITPLAGQNAIRTLVLAGNPITDFSALYAIKGLKTVILSREQVQYLPQPPEDCPFSVSVSE